MNSDEQMREFGEYFTGLLNASEYKSQAEVAHVLGISLKSVNNYANGKRLPTVITCEHIAFAFGVSIAEVRAAAGKPKTTSIDGVFDKHIRGLMLMMDWTPQRLYALQVFLEVMTEEQEKAEQEARDRRAEEAKERLATSERSTEHAAT